ncbi:hypothetical protein OHA72_48365 [Dactylosporangium sp. NBC_01737]|uniref:hypothetical protein n=1 Tax=Dactylosporangium sp. NBC_01737 TaxID=2975959 RepID=UPI002E140622|nr:hypothetical protein OHA72_48365 [Dactylosporangium sp. NBC_01737]
MRPRRFDGDDFLDRPCLGMYERPGPAGGQWATLSPQLRDRIDELLRDRRLVQAVALLPAQHGDRGEDRRAGPPGQRRGVAPQPGEPPAGRGGRDRQGDDQAGEPADHPRDVAVLDDDGAATGQLVGAPGNQDRTAQRQGVRHVGLDPGADQDQHQRCQRGEQDQRPPDPDPVVRVHAAILQTVIDVLASRTVPGMSAAFRWQQ